MKDSNSPKIVIIGAGAAGIGAARRLRQSNCNLVLLEARARLGGRVFTDAVASSYPLDLGCEWLHSADRNPLRKIAQDLDFTVDSSPAPWDKPSLKASMAPSDERDFSKAIDRFYERLDAAARGPKDRRASELLEPGCRWNALIDAISTHINGVELDRVSIFDGDNYDDSETDWRVVEGYGTLIARLGADFPVQMNTKVECIDHSDKRIRLTTSNGSFEADAVIVTVPTNVIASGRLRFLPDLPQKRDAAANLPLGVANKVFFSLDNAEEFERDTNVYGALDRVATGNYYLRIAGRPLLEGFFGGALARDLETGGLAAFADFASTELANVMGSAFCKRLHPIISTAWSSDPFSLGSYSYAVPGHVSDRAILAAPVDERIFFAGEACSKYYFSTAHGAYKSGQKAAKALLKTIARPSSPTANLASRISAWIFGS